MRHWLLWIHLASVAAFGGATLLMLVMGTTATQASPLSFAALRQAMTIGAEAVVVPALLLMIVSGMLLLVARPTLIEARWVWGKALVGVLVAAVALLQVQPATRHATALAVQGAMGSVLQSEERSVAGTRGPLDAALVSEQRGQWITLGLLLAGVGLAVWRPRLGRRDAD